MSIERLGNVLPATGSEQAEDGGSGPSGERVDPLEPDAVPVAGGTDEAVEFVRFCYRRRSVPWPELYDEMCAVAAREEFRGMGYEQLENHGIVLALQALPRLAAMVASVIAEERRTAPVAATA